MRTHTITCALAIAAVAGISNARIIHEDFLCFCGGPIFDIELDYDFGTDTDFTGSLDMYDLFAGELWLYSDLTTVTVNTLAPDEWIESIEITWTDACGIGCTELEVFGDTMSLIAPNTVVSQTEVVTLTTADLGEQIRYFTLSSFEGRIDEFTVTVVPTPASALLLGLAGLLMLPSRKR